MTGNEYRPVCDCNGATSVLWTLGSGTMESKRKEKPEIECLEYRGDHRMSDFFKIFIAHKEGERYVPALWFYWEKEEGWTFLENEEDGVGFAIFEQAEKMVENLMPVVEKARKLAGTKGDWVPDRLYLGIQGYTELRGGTVQ